MAIIIALLVGCLVFLVRIDDTLETILIEIHDQEYGDGDNETD